MLGGVILSDNNAYYAAKKKNRFYSHVQKTTQRIKKNFLQEI